MVEFDMDWAQTFALFVKNAAQISPNTSLELGHLVSLGMVIGEAKLKTKAC